MKIGTELFKETPVRFGSDETEKIWFCATDVCKALGYKNVSKAIIDNCKPKGITKSYTLTDGGGQELTYIDEANMYRLTLKCTKKEAEEFQDWVVETVLPSIRKTGSYSVQKQVNTFDFLQMQLDMMKAQDARISQVENKVKQIEAQSISSTVTYYAISGYASFIGKNVDVKTAADLGRKCANLCKTLGYVMGELPDPRFGRVKTYPIDVLESVFTEKNLQ